ncbi:MAG TPA: SPOR domain-containing protein [Desulfosalsimonadaceae bacterium]|nr:SPOR domain-containing protein [Desulfosalsimonadaceae bacterium]
MKNCKHLLQCILTICLVLSCARAGAAELEVQFGAFTIHSLAEQCQSKYSHLERDVIIKELANADGKSFYTVRAGPFASAKEAREFIGALSPKPEDRPWIMQADSMQPAARPGAENQKAGGEKPEARSAAEKKAAAPAAKKEHAEEKKKTVNGLAGQQPEKPAAKPETETSTAESAGGGLWGQGEAAPEEAQKETGKKEEKKTGDAKKPEEKEPKPAGEPPAESVQELQKQVKDLQEQVKTLMDAREVREELEATEEEKKKEEEDILSAAGREYTLLQKGRLGVEYKLSYSYFDYDAIREQNIIEHNSQHTITNTFIVEYPVKNNLTLQANVPYIYKYDKVGSDDSLDTTDFGDVDLGVNYQPFRAGKRFPSIIFRGTLTCPMGRDPYDINPETELSTGSGGYALQGSMSMSKAVDPIMVFGSLGYTYKHPIDNLDYKMGSYTLERYERGDTVDFSMGIGYSLSYITSLTFGYSYSYTFEAERHFKQARSQTYQTRTSSSLSIGTSWRISQKMRVNMSLGIGLTDDYFTLSFRFPYEFAL